MTEVSSMSETEGRRPSSLPPPPSERLPQPPQIFISDTEESRHKRKACRKVKKHNTVSGVTLEARRVLEHLLRRSLSDAPQHSDSSGGGNSDALSRHGKTYSTYTSRDVIPGELSHQNITDRMMKEKMNQLEMSLSESHDEPDYVYTHELVRRPLSVSSQGSGKHVHVPSSLASSQGPVPISQGSLSGSQGSSTKHLHQSPKSLRLGGQTTQCSSTKHGHVTLYHDDEDVSSTSTEDYEYTDPNEFLRRKKKSFFRRHTERLMHTFRRRKQRPLDLTELECCQDDHSPQKCMKKKKKSHKLASPFKSLRGTKSATEQDGSECAHMRESRRECIHQEVLRTASSSPEHVTHYTDIEQFHEESLRRKCTSPLSWKRGHKGHKDGHLSDGGKDKGLLDSFIRTIKKRSSFRTKRKPSTDTWRHSEENLRMRTLTPEQEAILRRYDVTRGGEIGSDSDLHTVHSWKEALGRRLELQAGESYLQDTSSRTSHTHIRRLTSHDGVVTSSEVVLSAGRVLQGGPDALVSGETNLDEPDYDEIEDQDDIDGFLGQMADLVTPKPFHERTVTEKELLYERIADQLCAIADHYNMGSPRSQKNSPTESYNVAELLIESSGSSELEGAVANKPGTVLRQESYKSRSSDEGDKVQTEASAVEKDLAAILRAKGDAASSSMPEMTPLVQNLAHTVSYTDFQAILGDSLGNKPGWHQVARMFRLTQSAVQLSGMTGPSVVRLKENTLRYFEDRMAGWIVKQGGWESVVEDTSSELD